MPMKVFISSEMTTVDDKRWRKAAIKEIDEIGHDPIFFENLPVRSFEGDQNACDKCRAMVRNSDLLIAIVDDTISDGMKIEIDEALKMLGEKKIIYYFTNKGMRDSKADEMWEMAKNGYLLKEILTPSALRKEIKKSIASYLEDALKSRKEQSSIIYNESIKLPPDYEFHKSFDLKKGDTITVTCLGTSHFYFGFYPRNEFVTLRKKDMGMFGFEPGTDDCQFTKEIKIEKNDDYYLVLRRSMWQPDSTEVQVKIKCERND
jgi:hypothetical protein